MANPAQIFIERTFNIETCCNCGVDFGMPSEVQRRRREDGQNFYCPNGHPQHYTVTEIQKLKAENERLQQDVNWQRQRREQTERQLSAAKGETTKLRKRISNGVCICCKRTFANLARHMKTQHPEQVAQ